MITQLQDLVNQQAENFCNSIGVLQQDAIPAHFPGLEKRPEIPKDQEKALNNNIKLFTNLIGRCAKNIDTIIDHLPSEECCPIIQSICLEKLEKENQEATKKLEEIVVEGEKILKWLQTAMCDIAQTQLDLLLMDVWGVT